MNHPRPIFVTKEKIEIMLNAYLIVKESGIDVKKDYDDFARGVCWAWYRNFNDVLLFSGFQNWVMSYAGNDCDKVIIADYGLLEPRIALLSKILDEWIDQSITIKTIFYAKTF